MSPLISCLTIAVKLTATIEKRLDRLAKRTGRVKSYYVREALLNRFYDLEDFYIAEKRLKEVIKEHCAGFHLQLRRGEERGSK